MMLQENKLKWISRIKTVVIFLLVASTAYFAVLWQISKYAHEKDAEINQLKMEYLDQKLTQ